MGMLTKIMVTTVKTVTVLPCVAASVADFRENHASTRLDCFWFRSMRRLSLRPCQLVIHSCQGRKLQDELTDLTALPAVFSIWPIRRR